MMDRTILEYGVYLDDWNGHSRFQISKSDRIVVYEQSVANRIKLGTKVVLSTTYLSKKAADRIVVRVHDPETVIHGTGTITSVNSDFGYLTSQQPNQSELVFFFARNFRHPNNQCGTLMNSLLPVGALVRYEAVPQDKHEKAKYRAVRVILLENPAKGSVANFPKVLKGKQGIIVRIIADRSLYLWSKELGKVYAPKSHLTGSKNHNLQVGQWLEFDVHEQETTDSSHWVVIKSHLIKDQLIYKTSKTFKPPHHINLEVVDCIGMITNVFGNNAILWSLKLGKVLLSKTTTKGWSEQLLRRGCCVSFIAEQIMKPEQEDVGWRAKSIESAPSSGLPSISFERCTAQLIDIPKSCYGMLYNEQFGKISFNWKDFYTFVSGDTQFRSAVKKHKYFDVRFTAAFEHWSVEWCAVYVQPGQEVKQQDEMPVKVEAECAASTAANDDDLFMELLDNELEEMQLNQNMQETLPDLIPSAHEEPLEEEEPMKDASCQTEPLLEFSLFRLVRDTPALLSVMKERHRDQILTMTQLLSHRFKPNYLSAKVECNWTGLEHRNVICQTASTPEQELANRLISDQQLFDLLMDIDPTLLLTLA